MKFMNYLSVVGALGFLSGVTATPIAEDALSLKSANEVSISDAIQAEQSFQPFHAESETEINPTSLEFDEDMSSDLMKRQTDGFRFKLHVVSATGRVLSIIIVDYIINNLPGVTDDRVTATFGTGNTSPANGPIQTAFFEGTAFRSDEATFDLSTKAISGVFQFNLDPTGAITSLARSAGIHLGNLVVANKLRIFNAKNTLVATLPL